MRGLCGLVKAELPLAVNKVRDSVPLPKKDLVLMAPSEKVVSGVLKSAVRKRTVPGSEQIPGSGASLLFHSILQIPHERGPTLLPILQVQSLITTDVKSGAQGHRASTQTSLWLLTSCPTNSQSLKCYYGHCAIIIKL